jgi:4-diphosphocytidyl-2-C-methyl-D-erythritol kinase
MVTLEKEIPIQAGLRRRQQRCGSRAVRASRGVEAPVADEALFAIAAGLGSDVPFFLVGGTAMGLGRGEEVYPWPTSHGGGLC